MNRRVPCSIQSNKSFEKQNTGYFSEAKSAPNPKLFISEEVPRLPL